MEYLPKPRPAGTPSAHAWRLRKLVLTPVLVAFCGASAAFAAVWQYSVPAPTAEGRKAYLWIPPNTPHVRGLVVACHNMLEKPLFERPAFRAALAENGLGVVLVFPGRDRGTADDKDSRPPNRSALELFLNPDFPKGGEDPKHAGEDLQKVLDALAAESGYPELRYAPLLPVGHSSAGSFVWHISQWDPSRVFALLPFKTGAKNDGPQGIPIFHIESEWFDYGKQAKDMWTKPSDMEGKLRARANGDHSLYGLYVDIGSGHCNVSDDSIRMIALFLKKAVAARIPAEAPVNGPVALKPVKDESGWLLDPATLGKPEGKPISYHEWKGDPKKAFWYLVRELAAAVQRHMATQLAKKPQHIGFIKDGKPDTDGGTFNISPRFLDDAGTFKLEAAYLQNLTDSNMQPPRTNLGHVNTPILYRVNSGGIVQVGPDTFRVCPHFGPTVPQGNPWEPTLIAYNLGDATYRPTEHPAHAFLNIINTQGQEQTIDFPKIPDQKALNLRPIKLQAKASTGLPVQFFMVSGPADIRGDTLVFDKLPARAKFPVRAIISAFQWGRPNDPKVRSAGPVTQEFFIQR
jgi:hypothetical protein